MLIARRKIDPVNATPCYLQNFDWIFHWKYERQRKLNNTGYFYKELFNNSHASAATPGPGTHTPDLSTNVANAMTSDVARTFTPFEDK